MKRGVWVVAILIIVIQSPTISRTWADVREGPGFGYCPPPVIPSCIERLAQSFGRRDLDLCGRDVLRFTRTLGSYRTCLARESERAIGSGNDAIARFRCLTRNRGMCPPSRRNGTVTLSP